MKEALVCGAGGFIGGHLVKKLKRQGYWVRGVDIKEHEFAETKADEFLLLDLRKPHNCWQALDLDAGPATLGRHPELIPSEGERPHEESRPDPSRGSGHAFDEVVHLAADTGSKSYSRLGAALCTDCLGLVLTAG